MGGSNLKLNFSAIVNNICPVGNPRFASKSPCIVWDKAGSEIIIVKSIERKNTSSEIACLFFTIPSF
jgi:hypothetical protein